MVLGLFAAGAAGAGTAATTAASWLAGTTAVTAGGATVMGGASSALSILQGVATAGSILSTVVGGIGSYREAKASAEMARLDGTQAELAGEERALRIKRDALMKAGAARVAFAASGVEIGSGSAGAVEDDIMGRARFETGIERSNAVQRALAAKLRAERFSTAGAFSALGAGAKALGQAGDFGIDLARRG